MKVGRPLGEDSIYAREIGANLRAVRLAGGAEKLRSLDPATRELLLQPFRYGNSRTVHNGGLAARGMKQRQRGIITQLEKQRAESREVTA